MSILAWAPSRQIGCGLAVLVLLITQPVFSQESQPTIDPGGTTTEMSEDQGAIQTTSSSTPRSLRISVTDVVRLVSTNNSELKVAYYNHLIERTRIAEAESIFEPVFFSGLSGGVNEVVFPQIFPTGALDPQGNPVFFQTIVSDSSTVLNAHAGVRGLFPTGATYELRMNTDFTDREAGGLVNPSLRTSTTASLTQPILRQAWLQYNEAGIQQAKYAESSSRQRFRRDILEKSFAVQQAYWDFVFSIKDLDVKRQSLELANRLLQINRVKVRTGVFAPIEIAAAEAEVANRSTEVLVAENAIAERADILRRLVLPFNSPADWDVELIPLDEPESSMVALPSLDECRETAVKDKPELVEARTSLRATALAVAVADNETLPRLDFNASANFTGLSDDISSSYTDAFLQEGAETWNVGLSFELPLGNQAARAKLSRARLQRDQSLLSYRNLELSAIEAVRRAYRNVSIAERTISSRRTAVTLKEEELKNEQIKLDNRVSTNFQVLQVQDSLSQRRSEVLRALVDYQIALAELALSMGSTPEAMRWPAKAK